MRIPILSIYPTKLYSNPFYANKTFRFLSKVQKTSSINFRKTFSTKIQGISNNEVETKQLIFEGPNFRLIRILKIFSIYTLGVAWTIVPIAWWNWDKLKSRIQAAKLNGAIIALAFVASTATTIILHNFMSPYVTKIYYHHTPSIIPLTSQVSAITPLTKITLETLSILSRPNHTILQLKDLKPEMNRVTLRWKIKNDYLINHENNQKNFWIDINNKSFKRKKGEENGKILDKIIKVINENNSGSFLLNQKKF